LFKGALDSAVMREIGRLRELTFRKVGEGTGTRRDLDAYDPHYEHLVLWDPKALRIVGSYRLAWRPCDRRARHGRAVYRQPVPVFAGAGIASGAGAGTGRSFIAPAYWRSRALDQLWQGIGLYLQRHPDLRYMFGPVSMSVSLPREAREWIAAAHQHYFGAPGLAAARQPFVFPLRCFEGVRREAGRPGCSKQAWANSSIIWMPWVSACRCSIASTSIWSNPKACSFSISARTPAFPVASMGW
jgi:hypothetical protein